MWTIATRVNRAQQQPDPILPGAAGIAHGFLAIVIEQPDDAENDWDAIGQQLEALAQPRDELLLALSIGQTFKPHTAVQRLGLLPSPRQERLLRRLGDHFPGRTHLIRTQHGHTATIDARLSGPSVVLIHSRSRMRDLSCDRPLFTAPSTDSDRIADASRLHQKGGAPPNLPEMFLG